MTHTNAGKFRLKIFNIKFHPIYGVNVLVI